MVKRNFRVSTESFLTVFIVHSHLSYPDGVLGGYGSVTPMDTRDSNWFLDKLLAQRPGFKLDRVADGGAGIGRVARNLLLPRCKVVDLVEQSPRLLNAAPAYLSHAPVSQFIAAPGESVNDVLGRIGTPQAASLLNRVNLLNVGLQVKLRNICLKCAHRCCAECI